MIQEEFRMKVIFFKAFRTFIENDNIQSYKQNTNMSWKLNLKNLNLYGARTISQVLILVYDLHGQENINIFFVLCEQFLILSYFLSNRLPNLFYGKFQNRKV